MALTSRISSESNKILESLTQTSGKSKIELIEEALKSYYFHEQMNVLSNEYAQLHQNQTLWKAELEERSELDGTLLDGIGDD